MAIAGFVKGTGQNDYKGQLTLFVLLSCMVAAMGGLIFGYDIGISGIYCIMLYFQHKDGYMFGSESLISSMS